MYNSLPILKHILSPLPLESGKVTNDTRTDVLPCIFVYPTRLGLEYSDKVINLYIPSLVTNCVFSSSLPPLSTFTAILYKLTTTTLQQALAEQVPPNTNRTAEADSGSPHSFVKK